MTNIEIAKEILKQIGGKRFAMITGCNGFMTINCGLRMNLPRNASRANRLEITLGGNDLYTMRFYKYSPAHMNMKTFEFITDKTKEIKTFENVFFDQLEELFTEVTELYTRF